MKKKNFFLNIHCMGDNNILTRCSWKMSLTNSASYIGIFNYDLQTYWKFNLKVKIIDVLFRSSTYSLLVYLQS